MDGVLVDAESSWVLVHEHFGTNNDDSLRAFLRGEIDDLEFIARDVARWKRVRGEVRWDEVRGVLDSAPLVPGAVETLRALRAEGVRTAIVSGGLRYLAQRVADAGGVDIVFANDVEVDPRGLLTGLGLAPVPLLEKASVLERIQRELGVGPSGTAALGNSHIDIAMFGLAGVSIAFNPVDEQTAMAATHVIRQRDLRAVLPVLLG
jgi:phosphoserine phosphatase